MNFNPGYITKAEQMLMNARARGKASRRHAADRDESQRITGRSVGHDVVFPADLAEEAQLQEHQEWTAGSKCDCIASGNPDKPKQHGADPHAKNCIFYLQKRLDSPESPDVSSLVSRLTPQLLKETVTMATLTQKRTTRDGRHVLYEIPGVGAVRFARGMFPKESDPPVSMEISGVFVAAKERKAVDPVKAAKRAEAKANVLENAQRLAAKHAARAVKAQARLEKILAKGKGGATSATEASAAGASDTSAAENAA